MDHSKKLAFLLLTFFVSQNDVLCKIKLTEDREEREFALRMLLRIAINHCHVPQKCRPRLMDALQKRLPVPECLEDKSGRYRQKVAECLDKELISDSRKTQLNSRLGAVCCDRDNWEQASELCLVACDSALFAVTLSPSVKANRVKMFCQDNGNPDDQGIRNCVFAAVSPFIGS